MGRDYTINCNPQEFKRKLTKILRQNGICFSEYMYIVHVYDNARSLCEASGIRVNDVCIQFHNTRAKHIAKVLNMIRLEYRDKSSRNLKDHIGFFCSEILFPVSVYWAESDENQEEYFSFPVHAPLYSKFRKLDDGEMRKAIIELEE